MLDLVQEQPLGVEYLTKIVSGKYISPVLLVGTSGVGKRFSVIEAIKESASRGDPNSSAIYQVTNNSHPDVFIIESEDGKDIGIDAVREVLQKASSYPMIAPYKYLVVDGADRLTTPAANALLKTLEEPPKSTRFFLLAESFSEVIPTIRSRCARIPYNRLSEEFIFRSVKPLVLDETKALVYTRLAEGSLGKAISYFGSNRLAFRDRCLALLKTCIQGDLSSIFSAVDGLGKDDLPLALRFLEYLLYDILMLSYNPAKIINQDILNDLRLVSKQLKNLGGIRRGLYTLVHTWNTSQISLDFHLKSFLASTFVG